jgi:predicted MPP superfamily phosphohydrolase
MALLLLALALVGHGMLWVALINRMHTIPISGATLDRLTYLAMLCAGLIPLALWCGLAGGPIAVLAGSPWLRVSWVGAGYVGLCWLAGAAAIVGWLRRQVLRRPPAVLRWQRSRLHDASRPVEVGRSSVEWEHHFLTRLPGNQALVLDVAERGLEVARLPLPLDGLRIAHLSDLHLGAGVGIAYFQEVVRLSNEFGPDLTVITGDLVDNDEHIAWIPGTLGRLAARYGIYFVLGNHDRWIDTERLCRTLAQSGLVHLGGRWLQLSVRGEPIVLAGNELPWFGPAADLRDAPPRARDGRPLRIALSHSPDQLAWAQAGDVDLLLAGHTHGGQIRLPWIGPILAPSRGGVKYASGTFHAPPTVMHVSRGIAGTIPLRMNCPPELGLLLLQPPAQLGASAPDFLRPGCAG